jgi:wyosine [tRNA(Phe)-imidazoG37] synthetase (radical SAM superfamily)
MNRHIFGPVPSRRLGYSLGVDAVKRKSCTFDCIYCQLGKTTSQEIKRTTFFDPEKVVKEVIEEFARGGQVDTVTFSGSGEPTLNADLGYMIRQVKAGLDRPVAVITNGSLLIEKDVRSDLLNADIVLPSLDAVSDDIFRYVNRPHFLIEIDSLIEGLRRFRSEYRGQIWLEVMLIKDINDDPDEINKLRGVLRSLKVDKVQLNTVVRPPLEEHVGRLEDQELEKIASFLGDGCEIICGFDRPALERDQREWTAIILETLKRRSLSVDDISKLTGMPSDEAKHCLQQLEKTGAIRSYDLGGSMFFKDIE